MRNGLTLFELLLVAGIIGILAASSAPFMVRTINWFHDLSKSETAVNQLYDTGLLVTRALTQDKTAITKLALSGDTLQFDGKAIQTGVTASWETRNDLGGVVLFRISTVSEPVETLSFVALPIR